MSSQNKRVVTPIEQREAYFLVGEKQEGADELLFPPEGLGLSVSSGAAKRPSGFRMKRAAQEEIGAWLREWGLLPGMFPRTHRNLGVIGETICRTATPPDGCMAKVKTFAAGLAFSQEDICDGIYDWEDCARKIARGAILCIETEIAKIEGRNGHFAWRRLPHFALEKDGERMRWIFSVYMRFAVIPCNKEER